VPFIREIFRKQGILNGIRAFMKLPLKSKLSIVLLMPFYIAWVFDFRLLRGIKLCALLYHPKFGLFKCYFDGFMDIDTLLEEMLFGYYYKFYEPSPTHIIVDVGATIGEFSIPVSKCVNKVYSIEGSPESFQTLKKNILCNNLKNCHAFFTMVGDYNGVCYIQEGRSSGGTKISLTENFKKLVKCPITRLDKILKNLERIDLLKIDAEAMGHKVLLGAKQILPNIQRIIMEVHTSEEEEIAMEIMKKFGFQVTTHKDPYGYPKFIIARREH